MVDRSKNQDLNSLLAYAKRARVDGDPTGFLSGSFVKSEFLLILGGYIEFDSEVPEFEKKRILTKVFYDTHFKKDLTEKLLLSECEKLEREYLNLPKIFYRVLTEISLHGTLDVPPIKIGNTHLTFNPKGNVGFTERAKLFRDSRIFSGFNLPFGYTRLSAGVKARTPFEAATQALNDMDLVRASWNLALNRSKYSRHSEGRPKPVNDIRLSPFHTLHDLKGRLATETYWYDPGYVSPSTLFVEKSRFTKLLEFSKKLRLRLAQLPLAYRNEMELALIRYVRALDSADLNDTFLRLWSLLENLTDSSKDPSQVTIRRAAFMFEDNVRSKLTLSYLANHRNKFVHAGSDSNDIEFLVFLLKSFVDELLIFHIGNKFSFKTRSDAAKFMELPPSKEDIDNRIIRLRQARKFIVS